MNILREDNKIVWLASYPRSGNTFLRTILWHCFGLRSGSFYPNDLGVNRELQELVGHIEQSSERQIQFPVGHPALVKTHELNRDDHPAIYLVRDGRAVCASVRHFFKGQFSMASIVNGNVPFGGWRRHIESWHPLNRPNTLLLKYEEMDSDLPTTIARIGEFLNREPLRVSMPDRLAIARIDGQWVKSPSKWESEFPADILRRFNAENADILRKFGYLSDSTIEGSDDYTDGHSVQSRAA